MLLSGGWSQQGFGSFPIRTVGEFLKRLNVSVTSLTIAAPVLLVAEVHMEETTALCANVLEVQAAVISLDAAECGVLARWDAHHPPTAGTK